MNVYFGFFWVFFLAFVGTIIARVLKDEYDNFPSCAILASVAVSFVIALTVFESSTANLYGLKFTNDNGEFSVLKICEIYGENEDTIQGCSNVPEIINGRVEGFVKIDSIKEYDTDKAILSYKTGYYTFNVVCDITEEVNALRPNDVVSVSGTVKAYGNYVVTINADDNVSVYTGFYMGGLARFTICVVLFFLGFIAGLALCTLFEILNEKCKKNTSHKKEKSNAKQSEKIEVIVEKTGARRYNKYGQNIRSIIQEMCPPDCKYNEASTLAKNMVDILYEICNTGDNLAITEELNAELSKLATKYHKSYLEIIRREIEKEQIEKARQAKQYEDMMIPRVKSVSKTLEKTYEV